MARRLLAGTLLIVLLGTALPPALATHGVTRGALKIGLHAPLTGAVPVPSDSVEKGKDLYFKWLEARGLDIHGRDVRVILRNDQFNPSAAVDVCREMVEEHHVFMIFGISGADQMTACARYAESVGVPYVSPAPSPAQAVKQLPHFFATSMAWKAQGRLLADFAVARQDARSRKNGVVYFDSPSWSEPVGSFRRGLEDRRADLHYERSIARTAGVAEARLVVEEMKAAGIENVFVQTSAVWFLQLLAAADEQNFRPRWLGIDSGIANDSVARVACRPGNVLHGARALSPYPGLVESDRFDPAFRKAVKRFYPEASPDDFMWHLWAIDKAIGKMLKVAGARLTRDRFAARVERADIRTGILPTLRYRPSDHFGTNASHVLRADCERERWRTGPIFRRDF